MKIDTSPTLANRIRALPIVLCVLTLAWSSCAQAGPYKYNAPPSLAPLVEGVKDSVVNISTTQVVKGRPLEPFFGPNSPFKDFFGEEFYKRFFGQDNQKEFKTHSLGSGFVIDQEGYILTNNHVVEKATEIKIKLADGKEYDAKTIGRDSKTDLALIKVKPDKDFPKPVPLGDSEAIKVGDWLMAVGNPFGLGNSVTLGILSAKGRVIGAGPYDDFLQTDAAINPGNSGGPVFDMNGKAVGINTAIVAQGQGIGFAIPINIAKELLPQLKTGKITRGWLGVMIQDITPELARSFGLEQTKGVLVSEVMKDSPAEKAGLKRGDVITEFEGKPVENAHELSRVVAATPPNTSVKLTLIRNSKPQTVTVVLGTMPQEETGQPSVEEESAWGMTVQDLTPELAQRFGWSENESGVVVTSVETDSPAGDAGIKTGDLIKEINRKKVQDLKDYNEIMSKNKESESLLLLIKRGEGTFFVVVKK